jgi:hypothetical protein
LSIVDLTEPERAPDPKNYRVVLSPEAEYQFMGNAVLRARCIETWRQRAAEQGRRAVIVSGRYHQLAHEDL